MDLAIINHYRPLPDSIIHPIVLSGATAMMTAMRVERDMLSFFGRFLF